MDPDLEVDAAKAAPAALHAHAQAGGNAPSIPIDGNYKKLANGKKLADTFFNITERHQKASHPCRYES